MNKLEHNLNKYNGWDNYYSWAVNLWITSNDENTYKWFEELANNINLEEFKKEVNEFILSGGVVDIHEEAEKVVEEDVVNYKAIYGSLRE